MYGVFMITGIVQIALIVKDYDEAKEFYCGKLGFVVVEDTQLATKRWVRIKAPGYQGSEVLLSKATSENQIARIGNQTGGGALFFMHSDDFDSDYKRFYEMGVEFAESPRTEAYGKVAVFKDLYGNRIDLIQPSS